MTDELKLLISRTNDLIASVVKRSIVFSRFFSEQEIAVIMPILTKCGYEFMLFGGYQDAERCMVCISDIAVPEKNSFPITALSFSIAKGINAQHRDVLGALLSLGIKRELIGDIIFFDCICCIFVDLSIVQFVTQNLNTIAKNKIELKVYDGEINYQKQYTELQIVVSSLRLDCVVSAVFPCSRTKSVEIIESGLVYINGIQAVKKEKQVNIGDILTVRKKGKFKIDSVVGNTKKDRIKLKILKYN